MGKSGKRTYIHGTQEILIDLNYHIETGLPFSTVRFGDGCLAICVSLARRNNSLSFRWPEIKHYKDITQSIFWKLGIPPNEGTAVIKKLIWSANTANYIDSQDAVFVDLLTESSLGRQFNRTTNISSIWDRLVLHRRHWRKGHGVLASKWKEIHIQTGIKNQYYCNPWLHYFSLINGEYNLLDIIEGKRIFCISNRIENPVMLLRKTSGAEVVDYFRIPRRGGKRRGSRIHYPRYFPQVSNIIKRKARKYDLFLIGAGLLGKIYCGLVKQHGGRAFDLGQIFDIWNGKEIFSLPSNFLETRKGRLLFERVSNHNGRVW